MGTTQGIRSGGAKWINRSALAVAIACACAVFGAPAAIADTGDIIAPQNDPQSSEDGWQAGICKSDLPECSVDTPDQFFEQAGGHPPVGFTQFKIKTEGGQPVGNLKTVRVDLPAGLSVNPEATDRCELGPEEHPEAGTCSPDTQVGESFITVSDALGVPFGPLAAPVYNLEPEQNEPARFGFNLLGLDVFLEADIEWDGDYHEGFTIDVANLEKEGLPIGPLGEFLKVRLLENRLVFNGQAGDGTFLSAPTTCFDQNDSDHAHTYSTFLRADSYEVPDPNFPAGSSFFESELPPGTNPKECGSIPYDPSLSVDPDTDTTDSPAGPEITVDVPEVLPAEGEQASSHTRRARVALPEGMGINPSAAEGLETCTYGEFARNRSRPVDCPSDSKIGTASIETPPLPPGSLTGDVWVGDQIGREPESGDLYRIYVEAKSDRYGISARLVGRVHADSETGQLTTTFDNPAFGGLPQVPFTEFTLDFDGGDRAVLTSSPTCGPNKTSSKLTPWSGSSAARPSGSFTLSEAPGGGDCAKSLGDRPFDPDFDAGTDSSRAGAFSPLNMEIERPDGDQELKGVDVTLPPGLTAKLAGVEYCSENDISVANARSGDAEAANPSCPSTSYVGSAKIETGSGPKPIDIDGKVFLAGPYNGAPLSLAVITPATAGPFDLGTVVVRVALRVDPQTAQVTAESDPIPHVYGGALLDLRSIKVRLDRKGFSLNGTNCQASAFAGDLLGGGSDPTDSDDFDSESVSDDYQANGCKGLKFTPRLYLRMFGPRRRARNPKLRAVLAAPKGQANVGRAAVVLPSSLILDQANIAKVCTRVQYAANQCPKNSVYGYARAFSPLLDEPLQGPVYLRSSDNVLPDLVSKLRGQVAIDLDSRTDSVKGRIRNVFPIVPDVPISKFLLVLRGGPKGILTNSSNQCPRVLQRAAIKRRRAQRRGARRSDAATASRRPASRAARRRKQRQGRARVRKRIRALTVAATGLNGQNGKKVRRGVRIGRNCLPHRKQGAARGKGQRRGRNARGRR